MTNPKPNAFGQNHQENQFIDFRKLNHEEGKSPFSLFVINLKPCENGAFKNDETNDRRVEHSSGKKLIFTVAFTLSETENARC